MANKHLKLVRAEIAGTVVTESNALYQAYEKGCFCYQFQHRDGTLSRIMRCRSASELLWLTEQVAKGDPVIIGESVPM